MKAPLLSKRRMMPPTPLQNSYSPFEEEQGHFEVEDQMWSARDRTIIAKTKQYLQEGKSLKVEIKELDSAGPRRILEEARDEKGCAIFETSSTDGASEFSVVSRSRWDKHQRRRNASCRKNRLLLQVKHSDKMAWNSRELDGAHRKERSWVHWNYLENCVHTKVDIEALELLMEQENEEVLLRRILKCSTRGGSNIFQLFGTAEKKDHFVASRKRWLESQGRKAAQQESWQNEWHDIE